MDTLGRLGVLLLALIVLGCGTRASERRPPERRPPTELRVDVFADTGRTERLTVAPPVASGVGPPPSARVWLAQVTPTRATPIEAPLPVPSPSEVEEPAPSPPPLELDPRLEPPLPRHVATLRVPRHVRRASVDLDVRVAEDGSVSDALWAGGSADSALVEAAIECARSMTFFPARQAGRAVAVWCRQRFDFGAR
jgi:TonB family protein